MTADEIVKKGLNAEILGKKVKDMPLVELYAAVGYLLEKISRLEEQVSVLTEAVEMRDAIVNRMAGKVN